MSKCLAIGEPKWIRISAFFFAPKNFQDPSFWEKTAVLRHIFEAGFLLISFHLSHHQRNTWTYLPNDQPREARSNYWTLDMLCPFCVNFAKIHQVWTSKSEWCPKRTNFFGWGGGIPEFMMWTFFLTPFDPTFFQQAFRARGKSCIVSSPVPQPTCQEKRDTSHLKKHHSGGGFSIMWHWFETKCKKQHVQQTCILVFFFRSISASKNVAFGFCPHMQLAIVI